MKKYLAILLLLPLTASAFTAIWEGTSTNSGGITPSKINGYHPYVQAKYFVGSSTATSTFAGGLFSVGLSSSQGLTITGGALRLNNESFTDLTGSGLLNTSGVLTLDTSGDWTGTFDGFEASAFEMGLTAGDGLTRTVNDFDCDTASGSVFGCLTAADWTTFNNKVSTTRTLTAGSGLTGGGDLSADRTFTVGAGTCITVNADDVAVTSNCTDAATLDGIDSGSFLRSDTSDNFTSGTLTIDAGGNLVVAGTFNVTNTGTSSIPKLISNIVVASSSQFETVQTGRLIATSTATSTFAGGISINKTYGLEINGYSQLAQIVGLDHDTGLGFDGPDILSLHTGGVNRMYVNASGNIGIATSAPGQILSVQGVGNFTPGTSTMYTGLNVTGLRATSSGITVTGGGSIKTDLTDGRFIFSNGGVLTAANQTTYSSSDGVFDHRCISDGGTVNCFKVTADGGGIPVISVYDAGKILLNETGNNLGAVGIGTTSPSAWLALKAPSGGSYTSRMIAVADNNDDDQFIVTQDGRVAIGTTSPNNGLSLDKTTAGGFAASIINRSTTGQGLAIQTGATTDTNASMFKVSYGGSFPTVINCHPTVDTDIPECEFGANLNLNPTGGTMHSITGVSSISANSDISAGSFTDSGLTNKGVVFSENGTLAVDGTNFTWDDVNNRIGIGTSTPQTKFSMQTTEHSSTATSDFGIFDSAGREVLGLAAWSGGGGSTGYGSVVLNSHCSGGACRLGEVGGKNTVNNLRLADIIFETDSSNATGRTYLLNGVGGGAFRYGWYCTFRGDCSFNGGASTVLQLPTAKIHIRAGSTAAGDAPLKFTSGSLLNTAEAGAVEFLTDKWYATISTGAARKELTLNDKALGALGQIPFTTTNGRITDGGLFYTGGNLGNGTSTPRALLSAEATPNGTTPLFLLATSTGAGATSTAFIIDRNGKVGIGTTSPTATLSIAGNIFAQSGTSTFKNTATEGLELLDTGTAPIIGNATLVAGTVTVNTTKATSRSYVVLTRKTAGGTIGTAITYTTTSGSFTINSDNPLDTSTFTWMVINPKN